jgi:ABC-type sugar transport system ATPase subunit
MDEPTARLAPHERERLFDIMRRLAASGVGIYISHFLEEVEQIANRITVLRDGNVVASYCAGERTIEELTRLLTGPPSEQARAEEPAKVASRPASPAPFCSSIFRCAGDDRSISRSIRAKS